MQLNIVAKKLLADSIIAEMLLLLKEMKIIAKNMEFLRVFRVLPMSINLLMRFTQTKKIIKKMPVKFCYKMRLLSNTSDFSYTFVVYCSKEPF